MPIPNIFSPIIVIDFLTIFQNFEIDLSGYLIMPISRSFEIMVKRSRLIFCSWEVFIHISIHFEPKF